MKIPAIASPYPVPAGRRTAWLKVIAFHDELTGLYNHRYLRGQLARYQSSATARLPLIVLFLDLDGFKAINDRHGHAVGDEVLREVALLLRDVIGFDGLAYRIGGDEFVATLVGDDPQRAREIAEELRRRLSDSHTPLPMPGISIGWAVHPEEGDCLEDLVRIADQRMYENKRARRMAR